MPDAYALQARLNDGPRLPVDDASVDLVLVSLVLHSVPRAEEVGISGRLPGCS